MARRGVPSKASSVINDPCSGWLMRIVAPVNWIEPTPLSTNDSIVTRGTYRPGSENPPSRPPVAVNVWMRAPSNGASPMTKLPSAGSMSNALGSRTRPASAPTSMIFFTVSPVTV